MRKKCKHDTSRSEKFKRDRPAVETKRASGEASVARVARVGQGADLTNDWSADVIQQSNVISYQFIGS